jgi:hypothetical protein
LEEGRSVIDEDECVDCGACIRSGICALDAFYYPETPWPRSIRGMFSGGGLSYGPPSEGWNYDYIKTKATVPYMDLEAYKSGPLGSGGRGTSEMKTNDITGRFRDECVGFALEFGRPGVGFRFRDIEKASMALSRIGAVFEPENPYSVLIDLDTGEIKEEYKDIRNEKALSAIVECLAPKEKLPELYETAIEVADEIETVFTMDIISKMDGDDIILKPILDEAGIKVRVNGKTNIGLGRPLIR